MLVAISATARRMTPPCVIGWPGHQWLDAVQTVMVRERVSMPPARSPLSRRRQTSHGETRPRRGSGRGERSRAYTFQISVTVEGGGQGIAGRTDVA